MGQPHRRSKTEAFRARGVAMAMKPHIRWRDGKWHCWGTLFCTGQGPTPSAAYADWAINKGLLKKILEDARKPNW